LILKLADYEIWNIVLILCRSKGK